MTVEDLFSLQTDMNKLRSAYIKLAEHENFNPYKSLEIKDAPGGSGAKNFLEWYTEEKEKLESEIEFYKRKIQEDRRMIDEYISQAPYPECDIIRYRAVNNLSWKEVGDLTGYSRFQASRKFWNYLSKDARNARDAHPEV